MMPLHVEEEAEAGMVVVQVVFVVLVEVLALSPGRGASIQTLRQVCNMVMVKSSFIMWPTSLNILRKIRYKAYSIRYSNAT